MYRLLAALAVLALHCGILQAGQKETPPAPGGGRAIPDLRVLRLKHATADSVSQDLANLLGPPISKRFRVVADPRSNSLLVVATDEDFAVIKRYVQTLDEIRPDEPAPAERQFRVFPLGRTVPDKAFEAGLSAVIPPKDDAFFVVDRERRLLIVTGNARVMKAAEEYLRHFEAARERPAEVRVRLVWLATGFSARKDAVLPPAGLKEVTDELGNLGVGDLRLVSQFMIDCTAGKEFRSQGVATLDSPCNLSLSGTVQERAGEAATLQLSLEATRGAASPVCKLSTEIVTPTGQYVVLGVTPTQGSTSVFVVQVLPAGGKAGPKKRP
jgi:hypothetical protein